MLSGWRYIATRLNPFTGVETLLYQDLPLQGVSIGRTLSGPGEFTASIGVEFEALKNPDGTSLFEPWATCLYAEIDGFIYGGGILTAAPTQGQNINLTCMGFAGYPTGMPYTDSKFFVKTDPIDIAREIWAHLQSRPGGNLGVTLDPTKSPVRTGTSLTQDQFDTQSGPLTLESGAYLLRWYDNVDCGAAFDALSQSTPFDYREQLTWADADHTHTVKRIEIGYPKLGSRRQDIQFMSDVNLFDLPSVEHGTDNYANEVFLLGNGEGRTTKNATASMMAAESKAAVPHIRRVVAITDQTAKTAAQCAAAANDNLAQLRFTGGIDTVTVLNTEFAPFGSYDVGDEVLISGHDGWTDYSLWMRIMSLSYSPDGGDVATLSLALPESVNRAGIATETDDVTNDADWRSNA